MSKKEKKSLKEYIDYLSNLKLVLVNGKMVKDTTTIEEEKKSKKKKKKQK